MYSQEYKTRAVELSKQRGNATAVATELGIRVSMLYKWQLAHQTGLLSGSLIKEKSKEEQEIIRLRKALQEAKIERDILKKAISIFSKSGR